MAIAEPKTKAEFDKLLNAAKGNVVVDFVQDGCGACDPKALDALTQKCKDTTVVRVNCTEGWGSALADDLGVDATPTTLLAESGEKFRAADGLEEIDPKDPKTLSRIKCAR